MKLTYNKDIDVLYIELSDHDAATTQMVRDDVILDFDADDNLCGVEILNAGKQVANPFEMIYEFVPNANAVTVEKVSDEEIRERRRATLKKRKSKSTT